jgi:glycosyltransferase involved in cell wall biosynthesis
MDTIAIDARELRTSSGRYIERLLFYLQKTDTVNKYVVLLTAADIDSWEPTNPNFSKQLCPYKEFTFSEQIRFLRLLNKLKPDLVHFPMVQQPVFYRGKTVTTMNDLTTTRFRNLSKNLIVFRFKQEVYKWVNRRVAKKATALLTFSQFVKNDVIAFTHVNPQKITVTTLAADKLTDPAEPLPSLEGKQFLMYIGRPMSHKNLIRLVEAFRLLKTNHPDLELVLAGKRDTNYIELEKLTVAKGIKDITYTGFVSDGQLCWLYENCAAYVFPSLSEGFGLPGLEAMAQGAPVVSSNATCLPEVYGDAAEYFDPLDVNSMAKAIEQVIDDEGLRKSLVKKGLVQVSKYSWQITTNKTLDIYRSALGS